MMARATADPQPDNSIANRRKGFGSVRPTLVESGRSNLEAVELEHFPPVLRGPDGGGVAGNTCGACHLDRNVDILAGQQTTFSSIPGHSRWALAPIEMAWQGKSMGEVCRQLKDPRHNGGRSLELLHEHMAKDDLVSWGWNPGSGRAPVPGTQEQLGELIRAWIETGAECP
jgi:hypothetical protein